MADKWEETKRVLGEFVALMPASEAEHEERKGLPTHSEEVQYLNRKNYCGGRNEWTRLATGEMGYELHRCMNDAPQGLAQCDWCRTKESEGRQKRVAQIRQSHQAEELQQNAKRNNLNAPAGIFRPKGFK